jgi:crotonobetainyl-CoA:carnitine CoA-transferase CaiB-like acyl-CoA transferase
MTGPMSGIRVLDLGAMIAGPVAATVLSDQGADVIKVEAPGMGDLMRHLGANRNGISGLYHNANRGKRSLAVDLKASAGTQIVRQLAETADVVVQNFRPGVAQRLGLGYEDLSSLNPELVYLSVCGFGDRGPYAHKSAYDNVIQAFAGVAQSQANPQTGEPIQYYQLFCDKLTALTGSQAISAALYARSQGRGGQHIRLSMADAVVSFLWADVAGVDAFVSDDVEAGMTISKGVRLLAFKDGYGTAAPVTDAQFHGYCKAFGVDSSSPAFASVLERNRHAQEMAQLMRSVVERAATMHAADAIAALEAADVPCALAMHLADLPEHPQMVANESFARIDHPAAGTLIEPNNPPNFSATPSGDLRRSASLGEHTDVILAELGYAQTDIQALRDSGTVA